MWTSDSGRGHNARPGHQGFQPVRLPVEHRASSPPRSQDSAPASIPAVDHENQTWEWEGHRPTTRADRLFSDYESTIPPRISHLDPSFARSTLTALNEAIAAINELERDPNVLYAGISGALLRSESVGSSKIERLNVDARTLGLAAIDEAKPKSAAAQVWANVRAMTAAIDAAAHRPITADTFNGIHHTLMCNDPDEAASAGKWRDVQNWIGGSDECPRDAMHIPPSPQRVPALMADLAAWCDRQDIPPLTRAAIAHAQFETIHPYTDGNGRTGRAIIHTILRQGHLASASIVPTSSALLADVGGYFDSLAAYRDGNTDAYLTHFANATYRASIEAKALGSELRHIAADWETSGAYRQETVAATIAAGLIQQPVVSLHHNQAAGQHEPSSIYRAIDTLSAAGIISEITASKRDRVWVATEVAAALDEFSRRLGRRQDGR